MDYAQILTLISALTGTADDDFASLKSTGAASKTPITQIMCPRPLPAHEIEGKTVFCGTLHVPEDYTKPDGKKIALKFSILKAHSLYPETDPLVFLQGGPGGSAISQIPLYAGSFEAFRKTRDVVLFDQRSAGLSGQSVNCYNALAANAAKIAKGQFTSAEITGANKDSNTVADCLKEIEAAGIDITKYNTLENAKDVRSIVQALGYQTYNIYAISYGTKLALETMRQAPEGLRSVIIDGVAPPWLKLYETLTLKTSEVVENLVVQCREDETCNKVYPDLDKVIIETLHMAKQGKIVHQGKPVSPTTVFWPFEERNNRFGNLSMTPYLPAFIYELHRGKEMPTVDMLVGKNFVLRMPGDEDVAEASAPLPKEQRALLSTLADNAAIAQRINTSTQNVMEELRDAQDASINYGPVATLFDKELEKALLVRKTSDPAAVGNMLSDYVALQTEAPSKDALAGFVKAHVEGEAQARLQALIGSMSEAELAASFAIITRDAATSEAGFFGNMYLFNYACQEDVPFNTYEGYKTFTANNKYPYLGDDFDPLADMLFGACTSFKPQPRDNWQVPVVSDIPTLSIGGLYDSQTPVSWAKAATEKLSNAQFFAIPEAGHGAVLYQPCVADMGVAFINNPKRKLSDACAKSITISWHIPDWAKAGK